MGDPSPWESDQGRWKKRREVWEMLREQERDSNIVVKYFFRFSAGQEIRIPPKEWVG